MKARKIISKYVKASHICAGIKALVLLTAMFPLVFNTTHAYALPTQPICESFHDNRLKSSNLDLDTSKDSYLPGAGIYGCVWQDERNLHQYDEFLIPNDNWVDFRDNNLKSFGNIFWDPPSNFGKLTMNTAKLGNGCIYDIERENDHFFIAGTTKENDDIDTCQNTLRLAVLLYGDPGMPVDQNLNNVRVF